MKSSNVIAAALIGHCSLFGLSPQAWAQDIIVTRTDDPAPNGCLVGDCSLREAVIAANVDPNAYNDIRLAAGTYQVNGTPLAVTGGTRFQGVGNTQTLIRGDGITDVMTFAGVQQLDLVNLAIDAQGARELFAENANRIGIFRVRAPNPLGTIEIREPEGARGGGGSIFIGESEIAALIRCVDKGDCAVFDSRIARLRIFGTGPFGANGTDVYMSNVIVDGVLAAGQPSGVHITTSGFVEWIGVTVQDTNEGVEIGSNPLLGSGEFAIDRSRYVDNQRPMEISAMDGEISRTEFLDNINDDIDAPTPGALHVNTLANVLVEASTLAGNRGSSSSGGAILIDGDEPVLTVRNSTFSGNSIGVAAAGLPGGARGGAIGWSDDARDFSLILRHITVSAPFTVPTGLSGSAIGGFGDASEDTVRIYNSILSGTCSFAFGSIDFATGSIESRGNTCGLEPDSNQVNVSSSALALGSLGDNGGYTMTYVPGANSAARDNASATNCADDDQRGYIRPQGAGCDVGATESGDVIFADAFD